MKRAQRKNPGRVPRIALTGGIASGKTTVAKLFGALGAKLIDTDQIARDVVSPPSAVLDRIVERFGSGILLADGSLDRSRLRRIVFDDPRARRDLEAIIHPAIREEVEQLSRIAGGPYQLVAIPLLVETGTARSYDRVLLVDAGPETRKRRLMLRDGVDAAAAERMIEAQATQEERRAAADDIIENEGNVQDLAAQVRVLHDRYRALGQPSDGT
jgi:dephospho-CoA kinase